MNINFLPKELQNKSALRKLVNNKKFNATVATLFLGAAALGLIQNNVEASKGSQASTGLRSLVSANNEATVSNNMTEIIFGKNADNGEVQAMLEKQVKLVSTRKAFLPSLEVVKKHEQEIRRVAQAKGVPADVAIGIAFLENGGSEYAVSSAGAAGIYQLMPRTMESMGYSASDRRDVSKSIDAGLKYLTQNFKMFGDWGLTTWSYHAGEGNVSKALRVYARANSGIELPGFENTSAWRSYITENDITVHKLLSDPNVQRQVTDRLNDDSAGYPYKVMATAHLFELNKELGNAKFIEKLAMLNANIIQVAELF